MRETQPRRPVRRRRKKQTGRGVFCMLFVILFTVCLTSYLYLDSSFLSSKDQDRLGDGSIGGQMVTPDEIKEDVSYFLVAGVDLSTNLTDTIMLVCFDHKAGEASILQIPRDTYVGEDVPSGKMNAVYGSPKTVQWCERCGVAVPEGALSGDVHVVCGTKTVQKREGRVNALMRMLSEKLSLPIDHSIVFTIEGFRDLVDAMGGVDVYVPTSMSYGSLEEDGVEVYLEEGVQHLDGVQAEWFVRHRRSYAMGDLGRIQAQRNFFAGFAKKLMSLGMSDYVGLLPAVTENENVTTDMKGTELLGYAMNAKNLSVEDIKIFTLPGEGAWKDGVSYYSCHNDETVQLINEYFNPYMDKLTMKDVHFTELGRELAASGGQEGTLGDY